MTSDERIARIEVRIDDLQQDMRELNTYVKGPPREESLGGRMHKLEGNDAAAKAVTVALEAVRVMQAKRLSGRQTWLIAITGGIVALCAVTTTTVVLIQAMS